LQAAHALEVERGRIARDMHDHLGASLTRITLLSELVRREAHSPLQAQARAGELSESARQLARTLDEIVWAVNPQKDTLDHLLSYLSAHAEEFLTATNIHCRLDFPANPPAIRLPAEMRHNLFLVAKEALNNVVKHSGATEVWLRLSIEDSILILTVKDNGRGFGPDDVSAERNGLSNMRRRVETLGGEFTVSSRTGAGTTISARVRID
ncbi:MAG TPA: sensor histidine kinase, partial [Methylomirabilota bacterium]|nr:sensor histidine kinase [Methylomirabilota bacterium]